MLALGEETAAQAVVGSIVWAFRRLEEPRCREMSARGYALYSVCSNFPFFPAAVSYQHRVSGFIPNRQAVVIHANRSCQRGRAGMGVPG